MTIIHVVQFQFKELIPTEEVKSRWRGNDGGGAMRSGRQPMEQPVTWKGRRTRADACQICDSMLALRDNCVHPTSNKAYVKSIAGGLDNSPEGIQGGITHVFVVEFESAEDRDYYVHKDPAHLAFIEEAGPAILKARVVDFTPGVF
ncbi:LOW QUALITY PROTEIN: stress responsive A/B barrel domain-containing protein [Colletotrichum tofieldiae]|nr:LOW QUALITY PROTEIN: stress responsive A/B barrel domain-containing protein [Colletotrichum tofieldiae]